MARYDREALEGKVQGASPTTIRLITSELNGLMERVKELINRATLEESKGSSSDSQGGEETHPSSEFESPDSSKKPDPSSENENLSSENKNDFDLTPSSEESDSPKDDQKVKPTKTDHVKPPPQEKSEDSQAEIDEFLNRLNQLSEEHRQEISKIVSNMIEGFVKRAMTRLSNDPSTKKNSAESNDGEREQAIQSLISTASELQSVVQNLGLEVNFFDVLVNLLREESGKVYTHHKGDHKKKGDSNSRKASAASPPSPPSREDGPRLFTRIKRVFGRGEMSQER
mgnify:CR=1 FL=1